MPIVANTIAFAGRKAVINSYSPQYIAAFGTAPIEEQRAQIAAQYPNASVQTETLEYWEVEALVREANEMRPAGHRGYYSPTHDIGLHSRA